MRSASPSSRSRNMRKASTASEPAACTSWPACSACRSHFFDAHDGSGVISAERQEGAPDPSLFADRETIELAMVFSRIENSEIRRSLLDLARAAASSGPGPARKA